MVDRVIDRRRRVEPQDTFVAQIMQELATVDSLFQNPQSTATKMKDVFRDLAPEISYVGPTTPPDVTADSPEAQAHLFRAGKGQDIYVFESNDKEIWLDVSRLSEGDAGNAVYAAVADYAYNTGQVFIGDPAGLSDIALRRRSDAMLSSALKHGTTRHLAPHPRQVEGNQALGVPPLQWRDGDDLGNIQAMIDVTVESLAHFVPEFRRARYDFATRTFRTGKGEPLTDGMLGAWNEHPRVRAARAGSRTLKRGILLHTLARAESGQRPGLLERSLRQSRQLVEGGGLNRIFYSRFTDAPKESRFTEAVQKLDLKPQAEGERGVIARTITDAMGGNINLLALVPGRPLFAELGKAIPSARKYLRMKEEMDAVRNDWHAKMDETAQGWRKALSKDGDGNRKMMDLMHEATIAGVDPSRPFQSLVSALSDGGDRCGAAADGAAWTGLAKAYRLEGNLRGHGGYPAGTG